MGKLDDVKEYILTNKLRSIGIFWATTLGGSLAYQWSQPIPTQLKIIHSRVYAQALTLGSLAAVAFLEHQDHRSTTETELAKQHTRLAELERRWGFGQYGGTQDPTEASSK